MRYGYVSFSQSTCASTAMLLNLFFSEGTGGSNAKRCELEGPVQSLIVLARDRKQAQKGKGGAKGQSQVIAQVTYVRLEFNVLWAPEGPPSSFGESILLYSSRKKGTPISTGRNET